MEINELAVLAVPSGAEFCILCIARRFRFAGILTIESPERSERSAIVGLETLTLLYFQGFEGNHRT